jgi:protein-tyrosine phosphatase
VSARGPVTVQAGAPFEVLVLCTANICRSPIAEFLLGRALGATGDIRVRSAGLHARTGCPVDEQMGRLLGGPVPDFAARQVSAQMIRAADVVLTMTRHQRSAVVSAVPAAVRRTFTLPEFADLVDLAGRSEAGPPAETAAGRLAALTRQAPRLRSLRASGAHDDVNDPYGRDAAAYATAVSDIRQAVARIVRAVTPTPAGIAG